ncbi:hypothetical protein ColKHC_06575 [Colletotrichum higginsianum]|nr:hypothetical protein ColKHC_06575 [Colletotrichum higginsianum]
MSMTANEWEMQTMTRLTFFITVPFIDKRTLVIDTDKGAEHTFSRISDTGSLVSLASLANMLISRRTIVFGFNKLADAFSATLQDMNKFVGIDLNKLIVLKLITINGNLPLVLDTDKDFRNALWYRPGMEYAADLRLQFHLETTGLQSWLSVILDKIRVDKMLLIPRKKAKYGYSAKADVIQSTESVTCLCSISIPTSNLQFETCISLTEENLAVIMNVRRPETPTELGAISGSGGLLKSIGKWLAGVLKLDSLGLNDNLDRAT